MLGRGLLVVDPVVFLAHELLEFYLHDLALAVLQGMLLGLLVSLR